MHLDSPNIQHNWRKVSTAMKYPQPSIQTTKTA